MNSDTGTIRIGSRSTDYSLDVPFTLDQENRLKHLHIIGQTGTGKSTLLENLFLQDVYAGNGAVFVDPHGTSARTILNRIPRNRTRDVIYFNPADIEHAIGFNLLQAVPPARRDFVTGEIYSVFYAQWKSSWGMRMDDILKNTVRALLDAPTGSTLLGIQRMLTDDNYRAWIVHHCKNPDVVSFWRDEFGTWSAAKRSEWTQPVLNKARQFHRSAVLRHILGQAVSTLDLSEVMDKRRILIINLDKGQLGEADANLLGSLLLTGFYLAALKRFERVTKSTVDIDALAPFSIFVDEIQNFTSDTAPSMFSEIRKSAVSLTVAHQYLDQLSDTLAPALFGNVGTLISFRVGADDAHSLARKLDTTPSALVDLADFEIVTRTKVEDLSLTYRAKTDPLQYPSLGIADAHIAYTKNHYTTPADVVARRIERWRANDFITKATT